MIELIRIAIVGARCDWQVKIRRVPWLGRFAGALKYGSSSMEEYIEILVPDSGAAGTAPFYNDGPAIERIARLRAALGVQACA